MLGTEALQDAMVQHVLDMVEIASEYNYLASKEFAPQIIPVVSKLWGKSIEEMRAIIDWEGMSHGEVTTVLVYTYYALVRIHGYATSLSDEYADCCDPLTSITVTWVHCRCTHMILPGGGWVRSSTFCSTSRCPSYSRAHYHARDRDRALQKLSKRSRIIWSSSCLGWCYSWGCYRHCTRT